MSEKVTRGNGILEGLLASKRTEVANSLLPDRVRRGKVLDVGCGTSPYFLRHTEFDEKYGVDRLPHISASDASDPFIVLRYFDLTSGDPLPFEDNFFDAVVMLAVLEHLKSESIVAIVKEVHRVLRCGGVYVGTTPVWWANSILRGMARFRLVSGEEINEHQTLFGHRRLQTVVSEGGFSKELIRTGSFEVGMNLWFFAEKDTSCTSANLKR